MIVDIFWVIFSLVIGLGLLIMIHELGHFIMARRAGIRVEAFSIGFGRALWQWKRGDTAYKISWLPLGGYVKMTGQDDAGDTQENEAKDDPASFVNATVWSRVQVVLAGPVMNIVLACIIMPLVFMIGRERPAFEQASPVVDHVKRNSSAAVAGLQPGDRIVAINAQAVTTWRNVQDAMILAGDGSYTLTVDRGGKRHAVEMQANRWGDGFHPAGFITNQPIVDNVQAESPAAKAGMMDGDVVVAVAGQPIAYWDELTRALSAGRSLWFWFSTARAWGGALGPWVEYVGGAPLAITVRRADGLHTLAVEPSFDASKQRYLVGIRHDVDKAWETVPTFVQRYGPIDAVVLGTRENGRLLSLTGQFLGRLVRKPQQHYESLAGPVRIISMFAKIAQEGISPFLYFLAFFSLQLGFLNLLPIPVLDGGHLVFLGIEAIRRKPLNLKARAFAQQIGLVFLLSLFAIVTFNDLGSFEFIRNFFTRLF